VLLFHALKQAWRKGYSFSTLRADIVAGITVGVVAIPLGMALAIAVGVPPQHGLYTVVVAGLLAALFGGSRFNITGPTAAFVVILLPITQQYGLSGLMLATLMSGVILLLMGLLRLGQLVAYVPYPVTTGFTAGIGLVIAFLQLKDLFGLTVEGSPVHFPEKVMAYTSAMPSINYADAMVGFGTIATFILWAKLKNRIPPHVVALATGTVLALLMNRIPPHVVALATGTVLALLMNQWGASHVGLLGEKFHYQIGDLIGQGIPQVLPQLVMPWQDPQFSWGLVVELLPAAFTIAMLGCIESLLCAVVADGMTGTKHNPNAELVGQGLANMVVPFFGGIPATAAIARTATNIRAGGFSPVSAITHALFVLAAMIVLAPMLSFIPMSALAGLLIMVAWNMSEALSGFRYYPCIVCAGSDDRTGADAVLYSDECLGWIVDHGCLEHVGSPALCAYLEGGSPSGCCCIADMFYIDRGIRHGGCCRGGLGVGWSAVYPAYCHADQRDGC